MKIKIRVLKTPTYRRCKTDESWATSKTTKALLHSLNLVSEQRKTILSLYDSTRPKSRHTGHRRSTFVPGLLLGRA